VEQLPRFQPRGDRQLLQQLAVAVQHHNRPRYAAHLSLKGWEAGIE
jgi:hypothetical protein